tara:strand:- start:14135 stop:17653 length:3519 start_codon:yes stop_codon:yes gene_type:complete
MTAYQQKQLISKMTKKNYLNTNIMKDIISVCPSNRKLDIIGYKNMYWIRYEKELRSSLQEKPDYQILHANTKKYGRLYTFIKKEKVLGLLNKEKNINIYEHIVPDRKFKIFFDFDLPVNQEDKPTREQEDKLFNIVKTKIIEGLQTDNLAIDRTEPRRKNKTSWKLSYHIIVKDKYFNNLKELQDCGFKEWITEYMSDYGIDNIYTTYRWLKYPYQSKPNAPQQLPIRKKKHHSYEYNDIREHTATHFIGNETHINLDLFKKWKKDNKNISVKEVKKRLKSKDKISSLNKPEYKLSPTFDLKYNTASDILFTIPPQSYGKRIMRNILTWYIKGERGSFKTWWNWNKQGGMWGKKSVNEWDEGEEVFRKEWLEYAIHAKNSNTCYIKRGGFIKAILEKIYNTDIKSKAVEDFFNTLINYNEKDKELETFFWDMEKQKPELSGCEISDIIREKYGDKRTDAWETYGDDDDNYYVKVGNITFSNPKGYLTYAELKRFSDKQKYTLFNISMGGGKTYATMDYINKEQPKRILWITNRITLGRSIYGKINKMVDGKPFKFYKDIRGELGEDYKEMNEEHKGESLADIDRLIIEVESMKHIKDAESYDLIVADEIESLFLPFATDDTHGASYEDNWNSFKKVMKEAEKVFLMDAYLSTRTTQFIKDNDPDKYQLIMYNKRSLNKTYRQYKDFKNMIDNIITELKEGKKIYLFYPYKTGKGSLFKISIEDLANMIAKEVKDLNYLVYHGDINDDEKKKLGEVNELWSKQQLIITNSTISVGVSYDNPDMVFDKIYLTYAGFLYPRDIIQSSFRIRNTNDSEIGYCELKALGEILGDLSYKKEGLRSINIMSDDKTLNNLMKNMELEYLSKGNEGMRRFMQITGYEKTYINNEKLDDDRWDEIKDIKDIQDLWDWDNIFYEDSETHKNNITKYKKKRDNQTATFEEKIQIEKYEVMNFLSKEMCGDDYDAIGKEIYKKQFKQFRMVNRWLNTGDKKLLNLVFNKNTEEHTNKEEGNIYRKYNISLTKSKKWTDDDKQYVLDHIQLDKRFKNRYNNDKLQSKIVESYGIKSGRTNKEKKKAIKNDTLITEEERQLKLDNMKGTKNGNDLVTLNIISIIDTFNNFGRRNHKLCKRSTGEHEEVFEFLIEDDDEVVEIKKFRDRKDGEDYKSYLLLKSKHLNQ